MMRCSAAVIPGLREAARPGMWARDEACVALELHARRLFELRGRADVEEFLRVKPNMPANSAAGKCWMPVLYSCTALLKKRREAASLFSMSESSLATAGSSRWPSGPDSLRQANTGRARR